MGSIPISLCSDIVYSYCCPDFRVRYTASTCRTLWIRKSEYKWLSSKENWSLANPSFLMIWDHAETKDPTILDSGFNILFRARYALDLRIAESLSIVKINLVIW